MNPTRTWILIADGARARLLESTGKGKAVHAVAESTFTADHRRSGELLRDRPGRVFESATAGRHAAEPRTDPHRALKRFFAQQLADILAERLAARDYERLVLVAPPELLGDLRKALTESVQAVVVAEVPKDLTKVPDKDILQHLTDVTVL